MHKDCSAKLGLGTVQFGLNYGISNNQGQVTEEEISRILDYAQDKKIKVLDTARLYGNSEDVLGRNITSHTNFDIVTKTICFRKDIIQKTDIEEFEQAIDTSFKTLKTEHLYGLLSHHADDLLVENGHRLFEIMLKYKNAGKIKKIGASIYDAEQIDALLKRYDFDLIQLPLNIFDQRLIESGHLKKLKDHNIEIHVRSAFLQGLAFMNVNDLPSNLHGFQPYLDRLEKLTAEKRITRLQAALSFIMSIKAIDKVICGINNKTQLAELYEATRSLPTVDFKDFANLAINDPALVNPALWQ